MNALKQRCDTAPAEMRASLCSHGLRHIVVLLELPRTRNVDQCVVMQISRAQCLEAVLSQPPQQAQPELSVE